jgi:DNA-binding NtrC family response regulator
MSERHKIRKALIMEDEPVISNALQWTFKRAGWEVDIAENGQIVRGKIDAGNTYDFFIFDSGRRSSAASSSTNIWKLISRKKTQEVAFMTGDYLNAVTCAFLDRVKRPFINKPFTPDQIIDLAKHTFKSEVTTV